MLKKKKIKFAVRSYALSLHIEGYRFGTHFPNNITKRGPKELQDAASIK